MELQLREVRRDLLQIVWKQYTDYVASGGVLCWKGWSKIWRRQLLHIDIYHILLTFFSSRRQSPDRENLWRITNSIFRETLLLLPSDSPETIVDRMVLYCYGWLFDGLRFQFQLRIDEFIHDKTEADRENLKLLFEIGEKLALEEYKLRYPKQASYLSMIQSVSFISRGTGEKLAMLLFEGKSQTAVRLWMRIIGKPRVKASREWKGLDKKFRKDDKLEKKAAKRTKRMERRENRQRKKTDKKTP